MGRYLNKLTSYIEKHDFIQNPNLYVRIFRPAFIKEVIKEILSDAALLSKIASHSYTHFNGFDKITLHQTEKLKFRLHIWENITSLEKSLDENIHNHRWDFITTILTGAYYLKIYQKSKQGNKYHFYNYFPPEYGEYYKMDYLGQEKLKEVFSTRLITGNYYVIAKEVYHKVEPCLSDYTATLMLHNSGSDSDINVYSTELIENYFHISAKRFEVDELKEKFNRFIFNMDEEIQGKESIWMGRERNEIIDIVNENDEIVGQLPREFFYKNNIKNYRVVNAFIQNSKGQLFILRRNGNKDLFPLGLDMSVGGHVKAGESYENAVKREAKEELNLDLDNCIYREIGYLSPLKTKISSFSKTYLIKSNQTPDYNKNEFIEHFWLSPEEIIDRVKQGDLHKDDLPILISHFFLT